ncbi:MOSC domain protein [Rhizodiscina lignyota]|uniref:MOSC domain protein n=1 Tax=Rhizodiscina lignyota TaxID=1504668 RepID=A0A9P4ID92_9PEZI|nr:MOSC domain protein [Rhizodiscina lignyota]
MEITARDLFFWLFTILITGLPIIIYFGEKRVRKLSPSDWIPIPPATEIISLRIYPIKSCRGIEVPSVKLLKTGLDLDRQWMFIDVSEKHKFQTIREVSKLTLINTAINWETDELEISIANDKSNPPTKVVVPAHPSEEWLAENTTLTHAFIWSETHDAYVYPESISKPFSDFLDMEVRLVIRGPTPRVLRGCGAPKLLGRTEAIKWADMAPVLLTNVRSINELNNRLMQRGYDAITLERFRPNIVVAGSDAWAEDMWKTVKMSPRESDHGSSEKKKRNASIIMDVTSRCARCHVPNVDPDTGMAHKEQPFDLMYTYRRIDEGAKYKSCFGMLCAPRSEGTIKVGDKFEVTAVTAEHKFISPMK